MSSVSWDRLKTLFDEAAALEPDRREAYLRQVCDGDEELRRRVDALLAAEEDDAFLAPPERRDPGPAHEDLVGRTLADRYSIVEVIGAGGMGAVYAADDVRTGRRVAVKVVKRGMDTNQVLRRFHREGGALARLDHPNVARFLGVGATDDGRPFIAMEHVRGLRIDRWCDERRLGVEARIALFQKVCSAVHAAHQNLVVHRDLKPGNILITEEGEPKLLDFGLVKALDARVGDGGETQTTTEHRFLTPDYAAPEQLRGGGVTTSTDVYSLGVLLYELLAGERPFRGRGRETEDLDRVPPPPSQVIRSTQSAEDDEQRSRRRRVAEARRENTERLRRRLAGDLDTIVLAAMHPDPSRRYASAERLSDDLGRFLAGLPIAARPDTAIYRLSKFAGRHRRSLTFAGATAAVAIAAGVFAMSQQRVAERQRERAAMVEERMERVNALMLGALYGAGPNAGEGSERSVSVEELLAEAGRRVATELGDDPAARARMHQMFGGVYFARGRYEEAAPHLSTAVLLRRRVGGDREALARALHLLGVAFRNTGSLEASTSALEEAVEILREIHGEESNRVGGALDNLRLTALAEGRTDRAERLFWEAHRIYETTLGADSVYVVARASDLAAIRLAAGDVAEAERMYREAIGHLRPRAEEGPIYLAQTLSDLGALLLEHGRQREASDLLEEAIDTLRAGGDDRTQTLVRALALRARALAATGEQRAARRSLEEAIEIQSGLVGADGPEVESTRRLLDELAIPPTGG